MTDTLLPTDNKNVNPRFEGKLDAALAWAARGFRVFPLRENGKHPLPKMKNWQHLATDDPDKIREWWKCPVTGSEFDYNIGVCTTNLVVLDLDTKDGKKGVESFKGLGLAFTSLTVKTPSGGFHVYYCGQNVGNKVDLLGPGSGLDVRGFHGYVLAPGSTIDGVAYEIVKDSEIELVPEEVSPLLPPPRVRQVGTLETPDDSDDAVALGTHYLLNNAPIAIEGQGGNATTYGVCAHLTRDLGLSEDTALYLLLEHWNERCEPPWSGEELQALVEHSAQYGTSPMGCGTFEAMFGEINPKDVVTYDDGDGSSENDEGDTGETKSKIIPSPKMALEWFNAAADAALNTVHHPLVEGLLDEGGLSVVYGPSNVGKSFILLDLAFHVASGFPWNGKRTTQGFVLYVAAEGGVRIQQRLAALRKHLQERQGAEVLEPSLALVRYPVDLRSSTGDIKELLRIIREAESQKGKKCNWIIIDTLSRAMGGGDENSSVDMGALVSAAGTIQKRTGAHFTFIHHSGKDVAKGARGHSLLRAATDTEIEIARSRMEVTKQRDMDGDFKIGFQIRDIDIGFGKDGTVAKSAVVHWTPIVEGSRHEKKVVARKPPPGLTTFPESLDEALESGSIEIEVDGCPVTAVPDSAFRERYRRRLAETAHTGEATDKLEKRLSTYFTRHAKRAIDEKHLMAKEHGGERHFWRPSNRPTREAVQGLLH